MKSGISSGWLQGALVFSLSVALSESLPIGTQAEESAEPKSIRKTCGTCPEGYVTTGVTQAPAICKEGDPTLVQCVPIGANLLAVCGACPEGYQEIGGSFLPVRCGSQDGGRLSQCQLLKMDQTLPDPTQGFRRCPPDCGSMPAPGQGALPPPPKYQPAPESK